MLKFSISPQASNRGDFMNNFSRMIEHYFLLPIKWYKFVG